FSGYRIDLQIGFFSLSHKARVFKGSQGMPSVIAGHALLEFQVVERRGVSSQPDRAGRLESIGAPPRFSPRRWRSGLDRAPDGVWDWSESRPRPHPNPTLCSMWS